ncbi:MAG: autotransporter domain-containing protein [Proteobacteria bacterium]|nr:autotransporter domain-containing protein [Pseudomonadota bacterium]
MAVSLGFTLATSQALITNSNQALAGHSDRFPFHFVIQGQSSDIAVNEGETLGLINLTRTSLNVSTTATLRTVASTNAEFRAVADIHFTPINREVIFPPVETLHTFSFTALENTIYDGPAHSNLATILRDYAAAGFTLNQGSIGGASSIDIIADAFVQGRQRTQDVNILMFDNDPPPVLEVVAATSKVLEGGMANFTVRVNSTTNATATTTASRQAYPVEFLINGTAMANGTAMRVMIPALATEANFTVTVPRVASGVTAIDPIVVYFDDTASGVGSSLNYTIHNSQASASINVQPLPEVGIYWRNGTGMTLAGNQLVSALTVAEGDAGASTEFVIRRVDGQAMGNLAFFNFRITEPNGGVRSGYVGNGGAGNYINTDGTFGNLQNQQGAVTGLPTSIQPPGPGAPQGLGSINQDHNGIIVGVLYGNADDNPVWRRMVLELLPGIGYKIASGVRTANLTVFDDDPIIRFTQGNPYVLQGEMVTIASGINPNLNSITFNVTDTANVTGRDGGQAIIDFDDRDGTLMVETSLGTIGAGGNTSLVLTVGDNFTDGYALASSPQSFTYHVYSPPSISVDSPSITEGNDGVVTVTLSHRYPRDVVLNYVMRDGTASERDGDYNATSGTVVIPANTTTRTIAIAANSDTVLNEATTETFTVEVTADIPIAGGVRQQTERSTVTVVDDGNTGPIIRITATPNVVPPLANATFTVENVGSVSSNDLSVVVGITGAVSHFGGTPFVTGSQVTHSVNIPANAREASFNVTSSNVTGMAEMLVVVQNSANDSYSVANAPSNSARVQVFLAETNFDAATASVREGEGISLNLTLTPPQSEAVTIDYATVETSPTTIAGTDYVATSGSVTFSPGSTRRQIVVQTRENNIHQPGTPRSFAVTTRGQVAGQDVTAQVTITITDNDEVPLLLLSAPSRIAPGGKGRFTIRSVRTVAPTPLAVTIEVDGNASMIYPDPENDPLLATAVTSNGTMANVTLLAHAGVAHFDIEADAGSEETLAPIVVTLHHGMGYAVHASQSSTNTSVRSVRLDSAAVNEAILPQAVVAVVDEVGSAIAGRTHRSFGDAETADTRRGSFTIQGEDASSFALLLAGREAAREASERPWDAPDLLGRQSLMELPNSHDLAFSLPLQAGESRGGVTLWGGGFVREIDGIVNGVGFDGAVPGAVLGVDARVSDHLLAGVGFASASADFDYEVTEGSDGLAGSHETELSSYHPYVGYRTEGGTNVWGNLGFGEGEVVITQADDPARYIGEIEMTSLAVGFNRLAEAGRDRPGGSVISWNWHGDASLTNVEETPSLTTQAHFDDPTGSEISVGRVRLGATIAQTKNLDDGVGVLRQSIDLAVRHDSGDIAEGGAVELGGVLGVDLVSGIRFDVTARTLLFHEESIDDWGVRGDFNWVANPDGGGRGLEVRLTPEWGNSESQADGLLRDGVAGLAPGEEATRYGFDVRYGIRLLRGGLLVPYVAGDGDGVVYGGRYNWDGFAAGVESGVADDVGNAFVRYQRDF